ncbi:phosphatidylserine decarboxylase-like protein [Desarmillaria tabescens]|uniref:Phosphatidylserine decarboxylase-like protein n=1 Tax=Armillaria tabescens TaxID=1929756 RepID=A0AA39JCX4_ARMTA|nr:phosphatidylserine decarboxylase-like protein [Desarmillaria tabescens]KAK0440467.1 phosphatidylserine decarboxylase-like protein [Desarmillaria tabescens]
MSILVRHRIGGWLPRDHRILQRWLAKKIAQVDANPQPFQPVIQEFQNLIESNADIYMDFHQMFNQVPTKPPYDKDPTGKPQVRDYMNMLALFNQVITEAPDFEEASYDVGLVGFPINAILDWPMGTPAGLSAFSNDKVNAQFKKMFDVWAAFLTSSASRYVLTTDTTGWFGPNASEAMPNFAQTYVCDPTAQYYGFRSWDDFFTRLFQPGVHPVMFPDDDRIVISACESTVYKTASNIKALDTFWLKGEPYSLNHMLNNDPFVPQFVGGTVYQAFLSATKYHRWHSPVNGTVTKTVMIPGTYYAESPAMGFPNPDPGAPDLSQGFITAIAARSLIFIQADNRGIGLMCFVAVGMAEVSTCEITVKEGQVLKKGDEMGMFHFGGSTHCLIFRPGASVTFNPDYPVGADVPLHAPIVTIA